jgi:hypothetical protein
MIDAHDAGGGTDPAAVGQVFEDPLVRELAFGDVVEGNGLLAEGLTTVQAFESHDSAERLGFIRGQRRDTTSPVLVGQYDRDNLNWDKMGE